MAMAVLSVVLFSCVREEMTRDKELIVVQRIGEGGYVYTRTGLLRPFPNFIYIKHFLCPPHQWEVYAIPEVPCVV